MKILSLLTLSIFSFWFADDVYIYQVDCTEGAQWIEGKKVCSAHENDIYISMQSDIAHKDYTVFKLSIQNVSNDTVDVNPATMYVVRTYMNGKVDSVSVLNPMAEIEKSNKQIADSEQELEAISKSRNTQNTVVSIYQTLPPIRIGKGKPISTNGTQVSNTIYQEKMEVLTNKLTDAKREKVYWETNALLASSIASMSFVDKKVYVSMNHCVKATFHLHAGNNAFEFPITYVKL